MEIFLSFAGERSKEVAKVLKDLIERVIPVVEIWDASQIRRGARWREELYGKLEKVNHGISCLTKENINDRWILFEAGALLKNKKSKLFTFLLDLDHNDLQAPLQDQQHTVFEKGESEVWELLRAINGGLGGKGLPEHIIKKNFGDFWPIYEEKLNAIKNINAIILPQKMNEFIGNIKDAQFNENSINNNIIIERVAKIVNEYMEQSGTNFNSKGQVFFVLVCGFSAIGKTILAKNLKGQINKNNGLKADILQTAFYLNYPRDKKYGIGFQGYELKSIDNKYLYDLSEFDKDIKKLLNNTPVEKEHYEKYPGRKVGKVKVNPAPILIIEGAVSFGFVEHISVYNMIQIFMDAEPWKAKELKFAVDVLERNYSVDETFKRIDENYESFETHIRKKYFKNSDLIIKVDKYWSFELDCRRESPLYEIYERTN